MMLEDYLNYESKHAPGFEALNTMLNEVLSYGHQQGALAFLLPLDLFPELSHYRHIPIFHSRLVEPQTMFGGPKESMLRYLRDYDHE